MKISILKVGEGKAPGSKRVWLEGVAYAREGFLPGVHYSISEQGDALVLERDDAGRRKVSSKRGKPVIDLMSRFIAEKFGCYERVKVVLQNGRVIIKPAPVDAAVRRCKEQVRKWAREGVFPMVDVFTGGATSSKAAEHAVGGALKTVQHVECDPFYSELADRNHPASISIEARVQDMDLDDVAEAAVAALWLPCTDHSTQGRAKKGIKLPEAGEFGYLFFHALNIVRASNAAVVWIENVPSYRDSASMAVVRNVLRDMGYRWSDEDILRAPDFGAATRRERFIFIASRLGPVELPRRSDAPRMRLADVLEPEDAVEWLTPENSKSIRYFVEEHGKKHAEKGNGFGIEANSVMPDAEFMPTIPRTYGKLQPAGLLRRAEGVNEWRQFTPTEVLRAHQLEGCGLELPESKTRQYEVLGQGTVGGMVAALARATVEHLKAFAREREHANERQLSLLAA